MEARPEQPYYPAARAAATAVLCQFTRRIPLEETNVPIARRPTDEVAAAMINAAFWASLRREEGRTPLISLAYVSPEQVPFAMRFDQSLPMEPVTLTRLGPAVERPGIHLGIHVENGTPRVWGATRSLPAYCLVMEVVAPGFLIAKHSREKGSSKFVNIAVLEGDQIKVINHDALIEDGSASTSSFSKNFAATSEDGPNFLVQLAIAMRAHGRGGLLLVVPFDSERWQQSILSPIPYTVMPAFSGLFGDLPGEITRRAVDTVAGLTAVDGATIVTFDYHLLAFGAKIVRRSRSRIVDRVLITEPIYGTLPQIAEPAQLGGTRHLAAAQFVYDQRDAIALVASQDGRFTVFEWAHTDAMVHAHRIESVLI